MAITVQLAAATPFLLKYLLTHSVASASMSPTDVVQISNNANAVTPDLRTDAATGRTNGGGAVSPLLAIMRARVDGLVGQGFAAAALTQVQARAWLMSGAGSAAGIPNGLRAESHSISAECFITPRSDPGGRRWSVDASIDASGDPVLLVRVACLSGSVLGGAGLGPVGARALLTIRCRHTFNL